MALKELSDGGPLGVRLGQTSSDIVGFYGVTPVARPTAPTAAVSTAATGGSTAIVLWGFATSAQANAIVTAVNALIANQTTLGLSS